MNFSRLCTAILAIIIVCSLVVSCSSSSSIPLPSEPSEAKTENVNGTLINTDEQAETTEFQYEMYGSYIYDSSNNGMSVIDLNIDFWLGGSNIKENMPDKSCEFAGVTYTGKYINTECVKTFSYFQDNYRCDNGYEFSLNSDTGELVKISLTNKEFFETEYLREDIENPYESALIQAQNIADDFVDNLDDYEVQVTTRTYQKEIDGKSYEFDYYKIIYVKMIAGFESSDYVGITISSKGSVLAAVVGDIGAFDSLEAEISEDKIEKSINTKIQDAFKSYSKDISCEIEYQMITKYPTGEYFVYSQVGAIFNDIAEEHLSSAGALMLTYIGDK